MAQKRRLHVWEHHSLHNPGKAVPTHVIYDDHEFDYWLRDDAGFLILGWHYEAQYEDATSIKVQTEKGLPLTYLQKHPHTIIAPNMYAKIWLEEYDDEPTPLYDHAQTHEFSADDIRDTQTPIEDDEKVSPYKRFETAVEPLPQAHPKEGEYVDPELGKTKLVMPLVREPIVDKTTGIDLTHIANQIHGVAPISAGPIILDNASSDGDADEEEEITKEASLLGLTAPDVA